MLDIADGESRGFDPEHLGNDSVFVVRRGNRIYAYKDICPHYGSTTLPWKRHHYLDASSTYIVCAAHGALFKIENGLCLRGPCKGASLKQITVEVTTNNEIWIDL